MLACRFYWDVCMLVLLIANLIILPVTISFFNDDFSPRWVVFYVGSDAVLLLDVLINFRTGLSALLNHSLRILCFYVVDVVTRGGVVIMGVGRATNSSQVRVPAAPLHVTLVHTHVPLFTKQYKLVPAQAGS